MRLPFFVSLFLFALLSGVLPSVSQAEYRAFLLRISKTASPQNYRLVVSTLDPLQYPGYHRIGFDETVTYDDTWRCPGRTGNFKPICPSPRAPASEEADLSDGPENSPPTP